MDKKKYQGYINNFRRRLAQYLKPGFGLLCNVYPSDDGGAILEFVIGVNAENDDVYKESSKTLGAALSNIEQRAFGGNLEGFSFGGTNTILENNRIIYIKEANPNEWSDSAAKKEVKVIISNSQGASK
ncbi:MAG: hypothetical protein ISR96_03790 [Nitrospira sp.]|nr:hypothetical protein [bacterium]MBL7048636.1 hypothetical protein [Nitrospira sp.]